MNWFLDVFANDYTDDYTLAMGAIRRLQESDRSGPCEDDYESACPYGDILPEESDKENGSPLRFKS